MKSPEIWMPPIPKPEAFDQFGKIPTLKIMEITTETEQILMATQKTVTINISVVKLTNTSYMAICRLAGITVRNQVRSATEFEAVQNLLRALVYAEGDAGIALDLAIAGVSMEEVSDAPQLTDGEK